MASIEPEQVLAGIAATSRDCLVCTDPADMVTWAGPAVEEVLGWSPEDLVGRPYAVLLPAGSSEVLGRRSAAVLAGGTARRSWTCAGAVTVPSSR